MKGRKSKIFGVVMTLVLALTLAGVGATPVSADPGTLEWTAVPIPVVDENQLFPGSNVGPIAVTPDGGTLFAAVSEGPIVVLVTVAIDPLNPLIIDITYTDQDNTPGDLVNNFTVPAGTPAGTILPVTLAMDGATGLIDSGVLDINPAAPDGIVADATSTATSGAVQILGLNQSVVMGRYLVTGAATGTFTDGVGFAANFARDLYCSTDGGYTWRRTGEIGDGLVTALVINGDTSPIVAIVVSPEWADDDIVVVATEARLYMSDDQGETFDALTAVPLVVPANNVLISSLDVTVDGAGRLAILVGTKDMDNGDWGGVFLADAPAWTWKDQRVGNLPADSVYDVLAVAFSPYYAADEQLTAVVTDDVSAVPYAGFASWNGTETRFTTKYGPWESLSDPGQNWGALVADAKFKSWYDPDGAGPIELGYYYFPSEHASIAFPDDYNSNPDYGAFYPFVGLTAYGDVNPHIMMVLGMPAAIPPYMSLGDVYRVETLLGIMSEAVDLEMRGQADTGANVWSLAVSGDWADCTIVAGSEGMNYMEPYQLPVHTSGDGGTTWLPSLKFPTGVEMAIDVAGIWANSHTSLVMAPDFADSGVAYAGTIGPDSGFSVSTSGGAFWNQRGLIDSVLVAIADIAPSLEYAGDSTLFMVTTDTINMIQIPFIGWVTQAWSNVWKTSDEGIRWERVCTTIFTIDMATFAMLAFDMMELLPDGLLFITQRGSPTQAIVRSMDAGNSWIKRIPTDTPVNAWCPVDMNTIITGDLAGNLWRTTDAGFTWDELDETNQITGSVTSIAVGPDYPADETILVGDINGIVYISTDDGVTFERVPEVGAGLGAGITYVAFDADYTTNATIYAASSAPGAGISRFVIDESDNWAQIDIPFPGGTMPPGTTVSALVAAEDGTLYASNSQPAAVGPPPAGGVERSVDPTWPVAEGGPTFETVVNGLTGGETLVGLEVVPGSNILFAIDTNNVALLIFTDTLTDPVTLVSPLNNETSAGTIIEATALARVTLVWEAAPGATGYFWQVALDPDGDSIVTSGFTPGAVVPNVLLTPDTIYYWQVWAIAPLFSPASAVWTFSTGLGPAEARPNVLSPTSGTIGQCATDVSVENTVFQWTALVDADKYELVVATSHDLSTGKVIDKTGDDALDADSTAFTSDVTLTYDTDYFWQVRGLTLDAAGDVQSVSPWSDTGCFTTEAEPVPAAGEPTPPWVWALIAIGVIFAAAVIVLIMRTRRPI